MITLYSDIYPRCNVTQFIYFCKLLYTFRVVSPPIIRSTYNFIYSIWHLSNRNCYLSLSWRSWNCKQANSGIVAFTVWQVPDVVDTVVCAPDDGWRYHPKSVEQLTEINKLCNVASCWIYIMYLRCTDPWTLDSNIFLLHWNPSLGLEFVKLFKTNLILQVFTC